MKRTTVFLTDDLERRLQEAASRTHQPQAVLVREALTQYLERRPRPWPRSVGLAENLDQSVTSENVKDWLQKEWDQITEETG